MGELCPKSLNRGKNIVETGMMYDLDFPGENHITFHLIPDGSIIEKQLVDRFDL